MNKKALRKQLELALIKAIEETLNKRNALAAGQIKKKVNEASKLIAKKFYKTIKELKNENPVQRLAPARKPAAKKTAAKAPKKAKASGKKK
jgi:hypothetical protein